MRIAYFVYEFPTYSQTFVLNQIEGLLALGHSVHLFAFKRGKMQAFENNALKVTYLPSFQAGWVNRFVLKSIQKFDLIHAHFGPNGIIAMDLCKKNILKATGLVVSFHGYDLSRHLNEFGERVYQDLFDFADLFLVPSRLQRQLLIDLGSPQERTHVHYCGVALEFFRFQPRSILKEKKIAIISISRLVPKKGLHLSLEALAELKRQGVPFTYQILGEGGELKRLEEATARLNLKNEVEFLGQGSSHEVALLLSKSDLLLVPSCEAPDGDREGIPVCIMEAMSSGILVAASNHSAIPELVQDSITGFIFEENNSNAIVNVVRKILSTNGAELRAIQERARSTIEKTRNLATLNGNLEQLFKAYVLKKSENQR